MNLLDSIDKWRGIDEALHYDGAFKSFVGRWIGIIKLPYFSRAGLLLLSVK